ncbi:MAG: hypothetical protein JSV19_07400 [Phycisphaerales bacterium]|nr:MAG: hypothetical protein JSV19_07400 [Phycisphaerales bacterium]
MKHLAANAKPLSPPAGWKRPGFVLMEVLVALAILILGLTVIGSQIRTSWKASRLMERKYKAVLLAESMLATLDTGLPVPLELDNEVEGDWQEWDELFVDPGEESRHLPLGDLFPEFAWRLTVEPSGVEELTFVVLDILFDSSRRDTEEEYDFDEAKVLHTLYLLRATPSRLDLTRDFGMDVEQAEELAENLAGVGEFGLDPYDLDPGLFRDLEFEELIEVLPPLLQALGLDMDNILPMLPEELRTAMEAAEEELKGDPEGAETDEFAGEGPLPVGGDVPPDEEEAFPSDGDVGGPGEPGSRRPRRRGAASGESNGESRVERTDRRAGSRDRPRGEREGDRTGPEEEPRDRPRDRGRGRGRR